jgi:hypothetical protein
MKFKIVLFFVVVIAVRSVSAQIVMSSVGMISGTSSTVSSINFKSIASCIDIQSGIAVLKGERANGEFAYSCEVAMKFNSLGIKLYPNPVNNATRVKFVNTPPLNEIFNLQIFNTDGQFISSKKETGYNLFQGITIDLGNLNSGTYVLKIESNSFVDAIKFIKAN